ncbi:hypothetical protein [Pseudolysobacter antarcticus]|nr:hypothetical protein [Pseudolysobacter antarcticus]
MTALWGSLDAASVLAFGKFAGYAEILDIRAVIITAHLNFQQRLDAISALCEHLAPSYPKLSNYELVIKQLKAAQKARNKYAHNGATFNEETGKVELSYATARGSLRLHSETVHISDIKEANAKIHEGLCSLHSLVSGKELLPIWERA